MRIIQKPKMQEQALRPGNMTQGIRPTSTTNITTADESAQFRKTKMVKGAMDFS